METRLFRAFGYLVSTHRVYAGELVNLPPVVNNRFVVGDDFPSNWLYIKGDVTSVNAATGESITRRPGDCTLDAPWPKGEWVIDDTTDYEVFCLNAHANAAKNPPVPPMRTFRLLKGETTTIPQGTRLVLAEGELKIGDAAVFGVRPITFSTGDKEVTAASDSYGFVFL